MHGYKVAQLPFRISDYRYRRCHNDLTGESLGILVSLKVKPQWVSGRWKLIAKGQDWGEERVAEFSEDEVWALRVSREKVCISELAKGMHLAQRIVDVAREVVGKTPGFEEVAERMLDKQHRLVVKAVMANELNDRFHLELLETEYSLLTMVPATEVAK